MAAITHRTHSSRVYSDKICTVFKWRLEDFTILEKHYGKGIESPKFYVTDTDKASLKFLVKRDYSSYHYMYVSISLARELQYHSIRAEVSIFNELENSKVISQNKLLTKPLQDSSPPSTPLLIDILFDGKTLQSIQKEYLHDDTLTLLCEISIINEIKSSPLDIEVQGPLLVNEAREYLKELFQTQSLSDVTISVNNTEFRTHKLILSMYSPVLRAMFETEMVKQIERTVKITDVDATTFEAFLKYLYAGSIPQIEKNASKLLILADKYAVLCLYEQCERYIIDHFNISTVIDYLLIAESHSFLNLRNRALTFARSCGKAISDSTDFHKLCNYPDLIAQFLR